MNGQIDLVFYYYIKNEDNGEVVTQFFNPTSKSKCQELVVEVQKRSARPFCGEYFAGVYGWPVNWAFLRRLKDDLLSIDPEAADLLELDCCELHVIRGAFKTGHTKTQIDVQLELEKRGPRRGSTNRGLTGGPVTRGSKGFVQGLQANTEDQDEQFGQSAQVQASKKSTRARSFPIACRLPEESSSIAAGGTVAAAVGITPTIPAPPSQLTPDPPSTLHDSQPLGSTPALVRSVSSASSGAVTSDVTWTRIPTTTSSRNSRSSKSEYWQYFSKKITSTGEVRTVSYKVPCTSNMGNHMMASHS
ncbi:hypothetical protein DAPPUDRAFT_333206 [Daphnia pulex]|uniref:Uncharacterized protein n=1 Tax=Daphnia pulex TaxID=6669 RepID=E9HS73_DAPPU|nr:hypothetical protein DAPPUDRAFT_333206 [Daphnia pulex]|eukprot:EFX65413.1 hypothetical protein DAPPUDRAFT_333206 [Daphnia pulex]